MLLAAVESPWLVAVIGAFVLPLVTYLVAARRFSGRIESSEAADLWEESRSIRDWSQAHIKELREEIDTLRANHSECETHLAEATKRISALEAMTTTG